MKMVTSSAWLLLVLACVCVVKFEITLADEKACSIARYGTITMFNGETTELKLPCKYRLSDFTCGDYRVKVTPGSAVDKDYSHRFSPDTVWVKVVNAKTGDVLKIRTSVKRLDKLSKGKISNPWQVKEGSVSVVDFANYDRTKAAAVLKKDGVFSVEFSREERSVVVTCSDEEFVSNGLPEALCGDGTTPDAMNKATTTLFPGQDDVTDDALVSYVVLNHDNVVQSPTCKDLASKFTSCQDKEQAAMECVAIFGDQAECLAGSDTSLRDYYADCLTSVCDDVISALEPMDKYIREHCGPCQEDKRLYCPDGTCMYEDSLCNTDSDGCEDESDEMNCPLGCSGDNQFQCDNGYCIASTRVCDLRDDCNDGSDERNCEQVKCSNSRAKCADNTTCVRKSYFCNGRFNCPDGSDEDTDFCKDYTCLPGMAKCADNITCESICNARNECPDNEDEGPQLCKEHTCLPGEVKCADNATCVKGYALCNGYANCPDGLDEDPQFCKDHTCVPGTGRVKCADNPVCIQEYKLCDGRKNCLDNSDENPQMCEEHTCVHGWAKCADNVTCVRVWHFCDSFNNCPDNSDEDPEMCKDHTCVPGKAKKCADGVTCMKITYFCDGGNDCPDNSDEDPTLCGQGPE